MCEPSQGHRQPEGNAAELDLGELVRTTPVGMAVIDRDMRFLLCNEKLAEINGRPLEKHIGRTVAEMVPEIAPEVEGVFRKILGGEVDGLEFRVTGTTAKEPGRIRTWVENVRSITGADGQIGGLVVTVQEVTDIEEARAALAESERKLRASHQLSHDAFTILRAVREPDGEVSDFVWEFANQVAVETLKLGDLVGRRLLEALPGNRDHPDLFPRYVRLLESGGADEVELPYEADGISGWFRNSAFAIDADRLAVGFRDITRRHMAEKELQLVTQELKHRNRNLLTVVSGLLSLSARSTREVPRLVENVQKQLMALAASQDLLTATITGNVPLAGAVAAALEAFRDLRIEVGGGPDVMLPPRAVVPLVMALSEMATNSVKYGALSAMGTVALSWSRDDDRLELSWVEQDGPPVSKPRREGLGSRLLDAARQSLPEGEVERLFDRAGLIVRFRFRPES